MPQVKSASSPYIPVTKPPMARAASRRKAQKLPGMHGTESIWDWATRRKPNE